MLTQKSLCLWTRLEELATPGLCSWIGFRGFRDKLPKATAVSHLPGENYHTLAVCKDKAYPEAVLGKVEKKVPGSIFEPPQQDSSNVDSKDLAADPRASPRRMVCVCVCVRAKVLVGLFVQYELAALPELRSYMRGAASLASANLRSRRQATVISPRQI